MRNKIIGKLSNIFALIMRFLRVLTFTHIKKGFTRLIKETRAINFEKIKTGSPKVAKYIFKSIFASLLIVFRYINNLKYRNIKVGSTILILLFIISWFTEPVPESNELLIFDEDGKFVAAPPAPPSFVFPLGTDMGARSMVNLVLVGVKYTLGAVLGITLARLVVGGLLALITIIWLPGFKRYFSAFFWPFRYIPALLIAIILILPVAAIPLGLSAKIILEYQLIVLMMIGLPGVYFFIMDMVEEIKKQPFVLSSSLMGAGKFHLLVKHIWPNIKTHFLLLTTQQILQLLQLLTFLGIFSLYLGGPHSTPLTDEPKLIYRTISNELAGMAGQNFWLIRRAPWMAYSPILLIAVIALIVNWMKREAEDYITGVVPVTQRNQAKVQDTIKNERGIGSYSFVMLRTQSTPTVELEDKTYISDILREKLISILKFFRKFKVYRVSESLLLKLLSYISNIRKPVLTTIVTLSLVLFAGVFSYAEYRGFEKNAKEKAGDQKSVEASAEKEEKELFQTSFTNKEHIPANYKANLTYNDSDATLKGSLRVSTTNFSGKDLDKIYFHLYPNQFREPLDDPNWEFVLGPSPVPGWIDIQDIKVNNEKANFEVEGTILQIEIKNWADKATAEVDLQFNFQLPTNYSNSSYDYAAVWLGNFIPKQAVYDQNGWNLDPYSPIGYPFYSETANYDITLNAPSKYQILSNAEESTAAVEVKENKVKYIARIENVRDFAIVLLDKQYYEIERFMNNDTMVNVYYRPTTDDQMGASRNAQAAGQSLAFFEDMFDNVLPYKELDIIRTGEGNPQMSYQGMIFSPGYNFTDNYIGSLSMTEGVIRQWLSGTVGSQGYKEPWVNESLASYALKTYMGEKGYMTRQTPEEQIKRQEEIMRIETEGIFLGSSLNEFKNLNDYGALINTKGSDMYFELEYLVEIGKVRKALKEYIKLNTDKNVSGHDLIKTFEDAGGEKAKGYFKKSLKPANQDAQ